MHCFRPCAPSWRPFNELRFPPSRGSGVVRRFGGAGSACSSLEEPAVAADCISMLDHGAVRQLVELTLTETRRHNPIPPHTTVTLDTAETPASGDSEGI